MEKKYEVKAFANGGREGSVSTNDGQFYSRLSFPKELGGNGDAINPEQLFACGYAGCFSQATLAVKSELKLDKQAPIIEVEVQLFIDPETGFHIKAGIEGKFNDDWTKQEAIDFMLKAHHTCPYSKALKPENILYLKANGNDVKF